MLRRHPFLSLATLAYLGIVGWVTLGPQPLGREAQSLLFRAIRWLQAREATSWVTYSGIEFTANIAMFLPIGFLFVLLLGRRRWWLAIILAVFLTAAIEFTQLFLRDRVADPRDVLANSLGAILGVFLALILTWPKARALRRERAARARRVR